MSSHQFNYGMDSSSSSVETSVHPSYRMHHDPSSNGYDLHFTTDSDQFHPSEYFSFDLTPSVSHSLSNNEESLPSGSTSYSSNSTMTSTVDHKSKKEPHTPRPPNSFIIYRREKHAEIIADSKNSNTPNNNVISKIVANMWRQESPEVKSLYSAKAEEEKRLHMIKYPDYKYKPRKSNGKKVAKIMGASSCRKKQKMSVEPYKIPQHTHAMPKAIMAPPNYSSSDMHYFVPFELQFGWTDYEFPPSSFASAPIPHFSPMKADMPDYTDQSAFHVL